LNASHFFDREDNDKRAEITDLMWRGCRDFPDIIVSHDSPLFIKVMACFPKFFSFPEIFGPLQNFATVIFHLFNGGQQKVVKAGNQKSTDKSIGEAPESAGGQARPCGAISNVDAGDDFAGGPTPLKQAGQACHKSDSGGAYNSSGKS
jgi:hypothetical protein